MTVGEVVLNNNSFLHLLLPMKLIMCNFEEGGHLFLEICHKFSSETPMEFCIRGSEGLF